MSSSRASGGGAPHHGRVLGTAGHIDHGKTSLIRALTGVDCDRLPEEKQRGITIDLGFAALDLGSDIGRVSVVDVPGHERFVRTMVSGASGIDLVLLVVAADEGVMPQTREHVAICELLGVDRGVVALTKSDLADEEMRELAAEEVRDLLNSTPLSEAPIVPCSAETGDGIDALRKQLTHTALEAPARTARRGPPRLGIDRVFPVKGFGTVVTGTLVGSPLRTGMAVEVHPIGLETRIRGLQSHNEDVDAAQPGMRTAANLQNVDAAELSRGEVVSLAGALTPTLTADVKLNWLSDAPRADAVIAIELLTGTAERRARLAPIGSSGFTPSESGFARLHIEGDPLPLLPGDRFVARGFARNEHHGMTLGGGVILDVAPPHRRRSDPELLRELTIFEERDPEADVRERVLRSGLAGTSLNAIVRETGLAREEVESALQRLSEAALVERAGTDRAIGRTFVRRIATEFAAMVDDFHLAEPLRPGLPIGTLRGGADDNVPREVTDLAIAHLAAEGEITVDRDVARRPDHAPQLDPATLTLIERISSEARDAGLEPASPKEWAESLGVDATRFGDLVAHLEREGVLIRAPGDLWFDRAAIDELISRVRSHLSDHEAIDTSTYKKITGTSRRTTVPLMELLDELKVTRRDGDRRIAR